MDRKLVIVLLDACRGDYICEDWTPFLAKLRDESRYYKKLVPEFGFCERTEIFVGKKPSESNYFTAFGLCKSESLSRFHLHLMEKMIQYYGRVSSDGDETEKVILQAYEKEGPSFISLKSDPTLSKSTT